jgi:DNA-binding transcriptional LysR family regulator
VDLRQIECFLAVAEHLHFGRAADSLHLGQATVSESVARLERELNGALFARTTRRVELTALGETFLAEAAPGYEALRRAYERTRAASVAHDEELVVGYCHDSERRVMLGLVPELRRRHTNALIDFQPLSAVKMVEGLHDRSLDIGMCYTPVLDESLAASHLAESPLVALIRTGHPLALRSDVSLAEIAREPIVLLERSGNPNLYDRVTRALDETGVRWQLAATVSGVGNLAARALAGVGIAIAVSAAVPSSPVDGVVCIALSDAPAIEKVLVWRKDDSRGAVCDLVSLLIANFHKRTVRLGSVERAGTTAPREAAGQRRVS